MSKQRSKRIVPLPGEDPSLDQASALVQEYTGKIRAMVRRIYDIRDEYLAMVQKRLKPPSPPPDISRNVAQQEQQIWIQLVDSFRTRHDQCTKYLIDLLPHATKLALHVSQLIT